MSCDTSELKLDPDCELFRRGDPDGSTMSYFNRLSIPFGGVLLGVTTVAMSNFAVKRPMRSGLHKHVIAGLIGGFVGEQGHKLRLRMTAERDFQSYHYMTLHPEDFQPPKKVLFRDYIEPWFPIR